VIIWSWHWDFEIGEKTARLKFLPARLRGRPIVEAREASAHEAHWASQRKNLALPQMYFRNCKESDGKKKGGTERGEVAASKFCELHAKKEGHAKRGLKAKAQIKNT
jgi:hypothetical protein